MNHHAASASSNDFPRLNGANFQIWKARVTASLDGEGLLGIVTKPDYAGDFDSGKSDSDDLDPSSAMDVDDEALDPANAKTEGDTPSSGSSEDDEASDADAQATKAPPKAISFAAKKRELERAKKAMAKSSNLSSKELRSMEAKKSPRVPDQDDGRHPRPRRQGCNGRIWYLQGPVQPVRRHLRPRRPHFLVEIRYEEDSDETRFFLELEQAMKATADATKQRHERRAEVDLPLPLHTECVEVITRDMEGEPQVHPREWSDSMAPAGSMITVGGQHKIPIGGIGRVALHVTPTKEVPTDIVLDGALFAPELHFNLFSVAQGTKEDFKVPFDKSGKCSLWYQNHAKIVAKTTPATGLYQFEANVKPATATSLAATWKDEPFLLWHKRMGHPNFSYLQAMLKQQSIQGLSAPDIYIQRLDQCSSCIYAKPHRQPFNKRTVDRAKFLLQKAHTDMNGPLPIPTLSGCQYFLTFIDDSTRYMFIYVIKRKSDLYECYEDFRKTALSVFRQDVGTLECTQNFYSEEVQVLQADNAREYEKLGRIIHRKYGTHSQFTNAYTPLQNGVAERRMRTLLGRTRALLLDGSLPNELWGKCVVRVANVLNMTASPNTGNKSPYKLWFGKQPSARYLRVFGCTGYVHVPEPHRHKLEVRAKKCIRDVTFNEKEYLTLQFFQQDTGRAVRESEMQSVEPTPRLQQPKPVLPPLREIIAQ
ncbi:hypothetical protein PybrP1_003638 [[Pythium] brassicae (nom. inval.)]|nr:hypothetical protein PybrP1_003638 [[Pythium] brassicae (nom. inval.)]